MTVNKGIVSLSAMFVAAAANAQTPAALPYSVSVGWAYLLDNGARSATTTSGFTATLGYHVASSVSGMGSSNLDSALEASFGRFSGHGNRIDQYSLLVVERAPFSAGTSAKSGFAPYYGLGLGIVRNEFIGNNSTGTSGGSTGIVRPAGLGAGSRSASNYSLAAKALLGVKFSQALFAEAAFNYNGTAGGSNMDTITVSVGLRF